MNDKIYTVINDLYGKTGFLDKYGGSLWVTVILGMIFFLIYSYYQIYNNLQPIKADWINQRCNPSVMPFAGLINPPDPKKMSAFDFTAQNFTGCIQTILSDIIGTFLAPFYYLVSSFTKIVTVLSEAVQEIRKLFNSIRKASTSVSKEVMERILSVMIPIQFIIIKVRDTMNKTQGVMLSGIYMLFGVYQTLIASLGAIMKIVASILISIAAIMIVLYFIPFGLGIPFAIPLLIIFIMTLVPGIMIYIIQVMILKQSAASLHHIPTCFVGDTLLTLYNGEKIKIKDVEVGMTLETDNAITSIMKLAFNNESIYELNGVYCTGDHSVMYNNQWLKVKNHPHSIETEMYCEDLYCINTTRKTVIINGTTFSDWDELDDLKIDMLKSRCNRYLPKNSGMSDIHTYLDGGFVSATKIELQDGHNVNIVDVEVNDVLRFGERVIGIIKIQADDLEIKRFKIGGSIVSGGPNLQVCDPSLGMRSTLDMYGEKIHEKYIYHLLTDKRTFCVDGIRYYDYNGCIDKYLPLENSILLKSTI